jgi:hypothetical protein
MEKRRKGKRKASENAAGLPRAYFLDRIPLVMERERLQRADQPPVEKRPIAHGLEELRTVLGDLARVALTSYSEVTNLTREDFQSPTYQKAGYGAMPERYGISDRYVYTLEYADGTQLIIMGGKFAPARRFTGDPAPDSLADNRESSNFIYKYNGKNMTTERLPNGRVNRITGKLGRPGGLLPLLREWAGNAVHTEQFTKDVQP